MMCRLGRHFQTALFQPALHHGDFIVLRLENAFRYGQYGFIVGALFRQHRHFFGLGVMGDHSLQETDIAAGVLNLGQIGRLLCGNYTARLSRRARLNYGHLSEYSHPYAQQQCAGSEFAQRLIKSKTPNLKHDFSPSPASVPLSSAQAIVPIDPLELVTNLRLS